MNLIINEGDVISLHQHPVGMFSKNISQLVEPLKQAFDITYFGYARLFDRGKASYLTTNPEFSEDFANNQFYKLGCLSDPKDYQPGYCLLDSLPASEAFRFARARYNLDHVLLITRQHENYCENVFFATSASNENMSNLYLNNLSSFDKFIDYFNDCAIDLIEKADASRFQYPANHCQETLLTPVFKNHLSAFSTLPLLTTKERECCFYLSQCLSLKEVAGNMVISPRTLEKHIAKLKLKLGCRSLTSLVVKLREYHEFNYK